MQFTPTFILLNNEASLAEGSLFIGLTSIRKATNSTKAEFYSGFFNLSIALERMMKLIVVVDFMLANDGSVPTKQQLKKYGHDLVSLYESTVNAGNKFEVESVSMPSPNSIEHEILCLLSEFAKYSRYHNLDSLRDGRGSSDDPLSKWDDVIDKVIRGDAPANKVQVALEDVVRVHEHISEHTFVYQADMKGNAMSTLNALLASAMHDLAAPYLMVRIFNLINPLTSVLSELGTRGFYGLPDENNNARVPDFSETLVYFRKTDSEIRRKKRWP